MTERCDCLNYCGDDDRVGKGLVEPCGGWKEAEERSRRAAERAKAHKDELIALRSLELLVRLYARNPRNAAVAADLADFDTILDQIDQARELARSHP